MFRSRLLHVRQKLPPANATKSTNRAPGVGARRAGVVLRSPAMADGHRGEPRPHAPSVAVAVAVKGRRPVAHHAYVRSRPCRRSAPETLAPSAHEVKYRPPRAVRPTTLAVGNGVRRARRRRDVVHLAFIVFVAVGASWSGAGTGSCGSTILPSPGVSASSPSATNARSRPSRGGFEARAGGDGYNGGFVDRYIENVIYPKELAALL